MTKKILMDNSDSEGHPTLHPFQSLDQPLAVLLFPFEWSDLP